MKTIVGKPIEEMEVEKGDLWWYQCQSIQEMKPGMMIRNTNGIIYMVTANYGDRAIAVRTADATNPQEWEVLK